MIDVHSHLLPGLDDGSRSVNQSVEVLRDFAADGVQAVVLTPHLRASQIVARGEEHLERRGQALQELQIQAPELPKLHQGFEIMLDQPLPAVAAGDRRFSMAGSRYYLVEFPFSVVAEFAVSVLRKIATADVVPVVAHPERYFTCGLEAVRAWRRVGALMQVDATTLTRRSRRGEAAREIVAAGLADVVAADNHGDGRSIRTALEFLSERGHAVAARLLTGDNPRAIVEDREVVEVPPTLLEEGWLGRLKRVFRG